MSTANRRGPNKPAAWRLNRVSIRKKDAGAMSMNMQKFDNPNERNARALELKSTNTKDVSKFSVSDGGHSFYFVVWSK
jgi:hypothetical protein